MPIEQLPGYVKVTTPEQAKPLPYTRTEVFTEGIFEGGLKETSWSYLADIKTEQASRTNLEQQELTQEEFENLPGVTPDMQYWPGMTIAQANQYIRAYDAKVRYAQMRQNETFFTPLYYMSGALVGTIPDPVNFLPLGLPLKGAKWFTNAYRAAGANAAIELALQPLASEAYQARGDTYDYTDFATNVGFAAGVGFGLSSLFSGARGLVNKLDGLSLMGHTKLVDTNVIRERMSKGGFDISDTFSDIISQSNVQINRLSTNNVRNTNPFTNAQAKSYVDTTGEIHGDASQAKTNTSVELTNIQGPGVVASKLIRGSNEDILKVLPHLKKFLQDGESITINRTDKPGRSFQLNKKDIDSFVNAEETIINRKILGADDEGRGVAINFFRDLRNLFITPFRAGLDDNFGFTSKEVDGVRYEAEFETKGGRQGFDPETGLGRMYEVKNGKRRLLSQDESVKAMNIIKKRGLSSIDDASAKNKNGIDESPTAQILDGEPEAKANMNKAVETANNQKKKDDLNKEDGVNKTTEELKAEGNAKPKLLKKYRYENRKQVWDTITSRVDYARLGIVWDEATQTAKQDLEVLKTLTKADRDRSNNTLNAFNNGTKLVAPLEGAQQTIENQIKGICG